MNANGRRLPRISFTFLTLLAAGLAQGATLPAETCTSTGAGARTCELTASVGTLPLPGGASVPAWTYALAGGAPSVPGPVLIVNQGETITVTLLNQLPVPTALLFHGQAMAPDLTGAAANGGTTSFTFLASSPGTFLYEAGLLPNSAPQVAMGLYGVLIVRPPTTGQAYPAASSAFDDEALVVLSEVDPALNTRADPATFDMRDFSPKYFLINGKAFPQTEEISTGAGRRVLLRYANAGLLNHSMALLGTDQRLLAVDGNLKGFEGRAVAESIGTGQTLDAIAEVPPLAPVGSRFALYEASFTLHNDGAPGFGGMLTFLSTGPPAGGGDLGPSTSAVLASPNPANGQLAVTLNAAIDNPGGTVAAAEYFIDLQGAPGTGAPMAALDGAFGGSSEGVEATLSLATLAALSSGNHVLSVRGQSGAGVWGPLNFAVLTLDRAGPATSGVVLMPNPASGSAEVMLSATGDDTTSGGGSVSAAEYFLDGVGAPGSGQPMLINLSSSQVSLTAMIPAATVAALAEGPHQVAVRSQDGLGNWGTPATATLQVDRTGPATLAFSATPNPNNGTAPFNAGTPAVRLTATLDDSAAGGSAIAGAELFIDAVGLPGTGAVFVPSDGLFSGPVEAAFSDIPLPTISLLSVGNHTLYAHARDAAGNWGPMSSLVFVIEKTAPVVSALSFAPNPTNAGPSENTSFTVSATGSDVGLGNSVIAGAEWFEGADPGPGRGTAMQATDGAFDSPTEGLSAAINFVARGWSVGNHTLSVRARDAAGNWSAVITGTVNVVNPNTIFADGFESGTLAAWNGGATGSAGLAVTAGAALVGTRGLAATLSGNLPRYLTDLSPVAEPAYHARFSFHPNGVNPGNGSQTIFSGRNGAALELFRVEFRRQGGRYQVRGWARTTTGPVTTPFVTITNAAHVLELAWSAANPAVFDLSVDGVLQRRTGLNTGPYRLESVRLGPSAGLANTASGIEQFDAFVSSRRTAIGP